MISWGKSLTDKTTKLGTTSVAQLHKSLRTPKPEIENAIRELRIIRNVDAREYANKKIRLPYIVCGKFDPAFRKIENFAYTEYFIVDIDHISQKELQIDEVRAKICADKRVHLCFISPSEDGLKVMFRLKERCYDAGQYNVFYKIFVKQFSEQYHLQQVIDKSTCDVSRACFISIDPEAYFNAESELVDMNDFANIDDSALFLEQKHFIEQEEKKNKANQSDSTEKKVKNNPDDEKMRHIKSILGTTPTKEKPKTPVYVPERLTEIMDDLLTYIKSFGIGVSEVCSISYGKKIKTKLGLKTAETNLFYGSKRGFTAVISPKNGTDPELNKVVAEIIDKFISDSL